MVFTDIEPILSVIELTLIVLTSIEFIRLCLSLYSKLKSLKKR